MPTRTITVHTYETKDGKPTCCLLAGSKECEFLGFKRLGTQPTCMLGEQVDLSRGGDGSGFIVPHDKCRLHYLSSDSQRLSHWGPKASQSAACWALSKPLDHKGFNIMPHPNGEPTEEEQKSFYSGFEWKAPKRPTGQMTTEGLRYMALTYLHLLEQNSGDDDDIRVMYAISMHPKIQELLSRSGEIMEAGK